jgi:hypothetical protein
MGVFFLQSDEECEMVNPYRTYKKTLYEFILYNSVVISCMFPSVIALIILPFILNLDFEIMCFVFGITIGVIMLIILIMLLITGKDLYIGIKKYKKQ